MPSRPSAAPELSSLLDGSSAGELTPDLARHGLQQLIELVTWTPATGPG